MAAEINEPENRGYADNGIAAFKEAAARLMQRRVRRASWIPATEMNHCIGTKTALAMLPAAFINPGDVTLMTVPGYPVAGTHTKYYGGEVYRLPLLAEERFLARLGGDSRRHPPPGEAAGVQLSQQPHRPRGHAGVLRPGDRLRPARTRWSSCRTRPT